MDELELQTKEVLAGEEVTKEIFPFQVHPALGLYDISQWPPDHDQAWVTTAVTGYGAEPSTSAPRCNSLCCSTLSTCSRTTRR